MNSGELVRTIGLPTATFIIIGYVVGASIFILPGTLAGDLGPAVFLAYALAAVPAVIAGFVMAQIGSALPISGANFVLVRDGLSPLAGFIYVWIMISMAAVVIPMLAIGFADYFTHFVPGIDRTLLASGVVICFILLNSLGVSVAAVTQNVLVFVFLLALLIFGLGGVTMGNTSLLDPLFPQGLSMLGLAAITAFFSYAGVFVIVEIAGEIKNPGKNIPLAILYSFIVIIMLYMLVPLAMNMLVPWQELGLSDRAVVTAAEVFMPDFMVTFVAVSALFAAATSVNGIMLGLSRDFFQGARSGLFPVIFARVQRGTHVPLGAVLMMGVLALTGIQIGAAITSYAQLSLIGLMIIQILTGLALLRLPKIMPDAFAQAKFRMGNRLLPVICILYILFSIGFLIVLSLEKPMLLLIGVSYLLLGLIYLWAWKRFVNPGTQQSGISGE